MYRFLYWYFLFDLSGLSNNIAAYHYFFNRGNAHNVECLENILRKPERQTARFGSAILLAIFPLPLILLPHPATILLGEESRERNSHQRNL